MAVVNVVEASVTWSGPSMKAIAGGTLTQGMAVYLDTTTGKYVATDCDVAASSIFAGWAVSAASNGQEFVLGYGDGELNCGGAVLTVGVFYFAAASAGEFGPRSDVTTGMFVCPVGLARTTSILRCGSLGYMSSAGAASA